MTGARTLTSRAWALAFVPACVWCAACDRHDDADRANDANSAAEKAREEAKRTDTEHSPTPINPLPSPINPPIEEKAGTGAAHVDDAADAKADLKAADGQDVEVEAKFYAVAGGVRVVAEIEDAKPGKHGFHVHETGDCSDLKGKSMGSHFSPEQHEHALPTETGAKHLGDLGNVVVDDKGEGRVEITVPGATLEPNDAKSFLGRALVFHLNEDTGKQHQPSGDSGDPIACGVIERT